MTEILLSDRPLSRKHVLGDSSGLLSAFTANNPHAPRGDLQPDTPYCLSPGRDPHAAAMSQTLHVLTPHQRHQLGCCAERFGNDTHALAAIYERHLASLDLHSAAGGGAGLAGMGATVLAARSGSFSGALEYYQDRLRALHQARRTGRLDAASRAELQGKIREAFDVLNNHYRRELDHLVPAANTGRNRGNALTGAARGITLAERSRARGLHLKDIHEASRLANFSRAVQHVGRGVLVLDVGIRLNTVRRVRAERGEWVREMAVQTGGLGGASVAAYGVGVGASHLMARIALAATPWGWAVLIGSAVVIGAVLAYQADQGGQGAAAGIWDRLF